MSHSDTNMPAFYYSMGLKIGLAFALLIPTLWVIWGLVHLVTVPDGLDANRFDGKFPHQFGVAHKPSPTVDEEWCYFRETEVNDSHSKQWGAVYTTNNQFFVINLFSDNEKINTDDNAARQFEEWAETVDCDLGLPRNSYNLRRFIGSLLALLIGGGLAFAASWRYDNQQFGLLYLLIGIAVIGILVFIILGHFLLLLPTGATLIFISLLFFNHDIANWYPNLFEFR